MLKFPVQYLSNLKNVASANAYQTLSFPRNYTVTSLSNTKEHPGKVVFISQSTDIYENLALEDWLYKNWSFEKRNLLLLWRNKPCVVIGRHQNAYVEANLPYLESAGVPVVRRNSGGGTVYHDEGNLNCSFFTPRSRYDRKGNLSIICEALRKDFNISSEINKRDDIIIEENKKISGTAAKLGRLSAYHHCTLLVAASKLQMKLALAGDKTLNSKATDSVPSPTENLTQVCSGLTVESLLMSVGKTYLESDNNRSDGFTLVNPSEDWFPGLDDLKSKLQCWEWMNGMTPFFDISRPVAICSEFSEGSSVLVKLEVYHGIIQEVVICGHVGNQLKNFFTNEIDPCFKGLHYESDVFLVIEDKLRGYSIEEKHSTGS